MDKKKRKIIIDDPKGALIFTNTNIRVYSDSNRLLFEVIDMFGTFDIIEFIAYLLYKKIYIPKKLLNISIEKVVKYDVNPERVLYLLTGGDDKWINSKMYNYKWEEVCSLYEHKFRELIFDMNDNAKMINDILNEIKTHLSIPILYEFALSNNIK